MLGVALGIGVLLALVGCTATEKCETPQDLVNQLVRRLEASVNLQETANPSVLLALNLAGGDSDGPVHKWLLQEIKEEAVKRAQKDMTSGQVALHVLALLSSCEDPQRVHALEQTLDLIHVLQQKTDEELARLEAEGVPKTTLYSMGLDTLALCLAGASGAQGPAVALAKQLLSPESRIFVDTRAMLAMALACVHNHVELQDVRELLREALWTVSNDFLDEQEERNGLVGNIYSMGLVLQALDVTREFYAPREWDCAQAFSVVHTHNYRQPMAIAQVLPALVGNSYLDAGRTNCAPKAPIRVHYSITNKLQGTHFHYSTSVTVPGGSTLLRVMEVAAKEDPQTFSFETEQTSWGPFVTSIHGLAGSTEDRTYWHFLSAGNALEEGVGTYKPHDGEHIQAVFSTY